MEATTTDTGAVVIYTRISDERYESLLVLLGPKGSGSGFWAIRNWTSCHLSGTASAAEAHRTTHSLPDIGRSDLGCDAVRTERYVWFG